MEAIKQISLHETAYPKVIEVINKLAQLEDRKPHDTARRLIIEAGEQRIKELTAPSEMTQPSMATSENSTT